MNDIELCERIAGEKRKVKCYFCGRENDYPDADKDVLRNRCQCGYVLFKNWYDFWKT